MNIAIGSMKRLECLERTDMYGLSLIHFLEKMSGDIALVKRIDGEWFVASVIEVKPATLDKKPKEKKDAEIPKAPERKPAKQPVKRPARSRRRTG